jgi:two-component system, cell cycle response regulator
MADQRLPNNVTNEREGPEELCAERSSPPCELSGVAEKEPPASDVVRRVLVVDDEPSIRKVLDGLLSQAGYEVLCASNGMEAVRILNSIGPQIVITDWEMPVMDGLQLCREIRQSETVGFVYAIILTSHTDRVVEAFDAGADDFLAKPPKKAELLARLKAAIRIIDLEAHLARQNREIHKVNAELTLLNHRLKEMAITDELTGLANRRVMIERLNSCWEAAVRRDQPLACLVMDLDHFKRFNDSYGHEVGDAVLKRVADTLSRHARSIEPVYRCGGEEFVVLCPDTNAEQATVAAERLRAAVERTEITHGDHVLRATISIGVAQRDPFSQSADDVLRLADAALYKAKAEGRNCVRVSRPGDQAGVACESSSRLGVQNPASSSSPTSGFRQ